MRPKIIPFRQPSQPKATAKGTGYATDEEMKFGPSSLLDHLKFPPRKANSTSPTASAADPKPETDTAT